MPEVGQAFGIFLSFPRKNLWIIWAKAYNTDKYFNLVPKYLN